MGGFGGSDQTVRRRRRRKDQGADKPTRGWASSHGSSEYRFATRGPAGKDGGGGHNRQEEEDCGEESERERDSGGFMEDTPEHT